MKKVDSWWSSLTVYQKERIASKIKGGQTNYPYCTDVWNGLEDSKKKKVYEHCTDAHGLIKPNWNEGKSFSY